MGHGVFYGRSLMVVCDYLLFCINQSQYVIGPKLRSLCSDSDPYWFLFVLFLHVNVSVCGLSCDS